MCLNFASFPPLWMERFNIAMLSACQFASHGDEGVLIEHLESKM